MVDIAVLKSLTGPMLVALSRAVAWLRFRDRKKLAFSVLAPITVASVFGERLADSTRIVFTDADGVEHESATLAVLYLRFCNIGRRPIRRDDFAPADPVRIRVEGARLLDIRVEAITRPACAISVSRDVSVAVPDSLLKFDFLDHRDGGLVRMVCDAPAPTIRIDGAIIGQPEGVSRVREIEDPWHFEGAGCARLGMIYIAAMAAPYWLYERIHGSWSGWWVIVIAELAFLLPMPLLLAASLVRDAHMRIGFPRSLDPPSGISDICGELPLHRRLAVEEVDQTTRERAANSSWSRRPACCMLRSLCFLRPQLNSGVEDVGKGH